MKRIALLIAGALAVALPALAAQPAATDAEPAVDFSRAPAATPPASAQPAATPPSATTATPSQQRPATAPTQDARATQPPRPATARDAADRIELSTTQVTGNAELPRVMYVVPWKRAELGEVAGKPARSLLDEVLAPVDRDVFRRQNRYYDALQPDAARAAPEGEK